MVAITLWFAWTGYIASDDAYYATGAAGWAFSFPYVSDYFATARAVIVLPMALIIRLFGEREFTMVVSTALFFAATASLTLVFLAKLVGVTRAFIASLIMTTVPLFALKATIPSADLPELFFVASSVWLFWLATQREHRFWLLVTTGACVALAFSAHEVTGALVIAYGLLFLAGFGFPRREYWIMAIGFFLIVGIECLYYLIMTGDPLRRLSMLFPVAAGAAGEGGDRVAAGFLQIAAGGTLHVHEAIDPLLMVFTNPNFGLLGFAAVPAVWWSCVTMRQDRSLPLVTARLMAFITLVWFLFAAILLRNAILIPRYYMVAAYFLFVIVVLWASLSLWPRRPRLLVALAGLFVAVNLLSIYLDEKNPRYGERMLTTYLAESEGPVGVDPETVHRVDLLCRWSGQDCSRIRSGPPDPGQAPVYFLYPPNVAKAGRKVTAGAASERYMPDPAWEVVWRRAEPEGLMARVLTGWGLDKVLPGAVYRKLAGANRYVVVYRLPQTVERPQ